MPLTEDQHLAFLVDGYLELSPATMTEADHRSLYREADELYALSEALRSPTAHLDILGDNLRARIPELDHLLGDPVVDGALTSLLGSGYLLHPHSYCHRSGDRDQLFHQDGNLPWNERGHYRSHRSDWVMLFYYPQDVDERNGPTEVVAGSQYWTVDNEKPDGSWHSGDRVDRFVDDEVLGAPDHGLRDRQQAESLTRGLPVPDLDRRFLHVPAGTVVMAHYDLFHRGSRAVDRAEPRYLYKFYFARVTEPTVATVAAGPRVGRRSSGPVRPEIRSIVDAQLRWARGEDDADEPVEVSEVERWSRLLSAGREDQKVDVAYGLGSAARSGGEAGRRAVEVLRDGLFGDTESTRRAAGHGLRQAGAAGIGPLLGGLDSSEAATRRPAVAGLGTVTAAGSPDAVTAVIRTLAADPDDLVRSNAAYSLGQISRHRGLDVEPIVEALLARLEAGAEADNAFGAGFSRSTVRQSAALALVQVLANHRLADRLIAAVIDGPLRDLDRYVQGLVVEGLSRAPAMAAADRMRVIRFLAGRRWNTAVQVTVTGEVT